MANELQAVYTTGATSPAIAVRNSAGNTWNGSAYVASSTLTTAAWQAILVAASELMTGDDPPVGTGLYVADMPAGVPAGTVSFVLYVGTEPDGEPAGNPARQRGLERHVDCARYCGGRQRLRYVQQPWRSGGP